MRNRLSLVGVVLALMAGPAFAAGKVGRTSMPRLAGAGSSPASIHLQVCGGSTGAPAGFSVQWMTAAEYAANGDSWYASEDARLCKASFSGNARLSRYELAAGECVVVDVGDLLFDNGASANCTGALACGTAYVVRSFAHATTTLGRSDFTGPVTLSTLACASGGGCTRPQDYWRFFNPPACLPNPGGLVCIDWPATSLTLGTASYSVEDTVAILATPAAGNGLLALAHQLIAAKLNVAAGADGAAVATTIGAADALIGALIVPPLGSGYLDPGITAAYTAILAGFNEGATGPGACSPADPGTDG
jgi:hypothetical protein